MTTKILIDRRANLLGSIWMVASMGIFAIEGAFMKAASATLSVGQILIIFGLGGAVVFAGLARFNSEPLFVQDVVSRPMRIRVIFEIVGRLFYVLAITLTPLSAATVIAAQLALSEQMDAEWVKWFVAEQIKPLRIT